MTFYELVLALEEKLNTPNFVGIQFKVNTDEEWKGTLSIRCNRVHLTEITSIVGLMVEAAKEFSHTIERISVNKCYRQETTSGKKVFIPDRRTIYLTARPPAEIFNELTRTIDKEVNIKFYNDISPLIEALAGGGQNNEGH